MLDVILEFTPHTDIFLSSSKRSWLSGPLLPSIKFLESQRWGYNPISTPSSIQRIRANTGLHTRNFRVDENDGHAMNSYWNFSKEFNGRDIRLCIIDTGLQTVRHTEAYHWLFRERTYATCNHGDYLADILMDDDNGMSPSISLYSFDAYDASISDAELSENIAKGIFWGIQKRVHIILITICTSAHTNALIQAINTALAENIIIITNALTTEGDRNGDLLFPAAYCNIICVSSHDKKCAPSNFSPFAREIDFLGPGEYIRSHDLVIHGTCVAATMFAGYCAKILHYLRDWFGVDIARIGTYGMKHLLRKLASSPGSHTKSHGYGTLLISNINLLTEHYLTKIFSDTGFYDMSQRVLEIRSINIRQIESSVSTQQLDSRHKLVTFPGDYIKMNITEERCFVIDKKSRLWVRIGKSGIFNKRCMSKIQIPDLRQLSISVQKQYIVISTGTRLLLFDDDMEFVKSFRFDFQDGVRYVKFFNHQFLLVWTMRGMVEIWDFLAVRLLITVENVDYFHFDLDGRAQVSTSKDTHFEIWVSEMRIDDVGHHDVSFHFE